MTEEIVAGTGGPLVTFSDLVANSKVGDTKINNNDRKSEYELKINTTTGDIIVNY